MRIYRQNKLPLIYQGLKFIRWHQNTNGALFVDTDEDIELIRLLQSIMKGNKCLSEFDSTYMLFFYADIPDEIIDLKGKTKSLMSWDYTFIKTYDPLYMFEGKRPCEAIDYDIPDNIVDKISCLDMVEKCSSAFSPEDFVELLKKIKECEREILI